MYERIRIMRLTICVVLLVALALPVMAQVNEWHATGVVNSCRLIQTTARNGLYIAVVEFQAGRNRPITCMFFDHSALAVHDAFRSKIDGLSICLRGRLRITKTRAFILVRDFEVK